MYNSWICFCFFVCEAMLLISLNYARRTLVGINISIYFAQFSFYSLLLSHFLVYYLFRRDLFFSFYSEHIWLITNFYLLFLVFLVAFDVLKQIERRNKKEKRIKSQCSIYNQQREKILYIFLCNNCYVLFFIY